MASVAKRKWTYQGVEKTAWVVRYVDQAGKRKQETFEQKKLADRFRLKVETELNQGIHIARSETVTVADACEVFLKDCERRIVIKDRMSRTGFANYRNAVQNFLIPAFGGTKLTDLTADAVQDWLNASAVASARSTVARSRYVLKGVLSLAVRKKLVARNVIIEGAVRVPSMEQKRIAIPSRANLIAILDAVGVWVAQDRHHVFHARRCAVLAAMLCGLRRGEISGLQWENVDFSAGLIRIRHSESLLDGLKAPKTWAGYRDVPMPPRVVAAFKALWDFRDRPATGYVIVSRTGRRVPPAEIWGYWSVVAERAGLCDDKGVPLFHFHALRHAAVSLLIADGLTPLHIKTFIGHAQVSTTMNVYGHLFPEDEQIRKSVCNIEAAFSTQQENRTESQVPVT